MTFRKIVLSQLFMRGGELEMHELDPNSDQFKPIIGARLIREMAEDAQKSEKSDKPSE